MIADKDIVEIAESENRKNATKKRTQSTEDQDDQILVAKRQKKYDLGSEHNEVLVEEGAEKVSGIKNIAEIRTQRQHQSPKKRLQFNSSNNKPHRKSEKFIYGNYSQYYSYRNKDKDYHDIRLDLFDQHADRIFTNKDILDIGCNSGFITMELAKRYTVKSIIGIDIDRSLINQANKQLVRQKKATLVEERNTHAARQYPYNVSFVHGNYVLRDDVLLEIEREQFDVILCLSLTKWIHLNFGDAGLRQAFRRMFLQLRSGGLLILEAQPFDNYGRRKKMTDTIYANFKAIQFLPKHFTDYLLSDEVGFQRMELLGVPDHCAAGFKRPINIFYK